MYPRKTYIRREKKTYLYVQLVQGYRRPGDGASRQRVVANLGQMTEQEFENLKAAFKASREGKTVIIPEEARRRLKNDKTKANLEYLHVAVLKQEWEVWELGRLLSDLIGDEQTAVPTCDVIRALTLQRCIAPRSKLYAQEWFPTTALPELLAISPGQFNNTRVHRALDTLYNCTPQLQEKLSTSYQEREGAFAAMFIDVTNTYFQGHGCDMAERSTTKEGLRNKWCIGIALLVNEKGYPLRWEVVPGKTKDHIAIEEIMVNLQKLDWAQNVPLVCDRAMGQRKSLRKAYATGLRFLTASRVDSIESYTTEMPWEAFSKIELGGTKASLKEDITEVAKVAKDTEEFERVDDRLFVMDLGVVDCPPDENKKKAGDGRHRRATGIQEQLRYAHELKEMKASGGFKTYKALAPTLGITQSEVSQRLSPLRLTPESLEYIQSLQSDVPIGVPRMRRLLRTKDASEQLRLLQEFAAPEIAVKDTEDGDDEGLLRVRLVAYFNPQMFVEQRLRARGHLEELEKFVAELNVELANAKKTRDEEATRRKIVRRLEKNNYVDAFDISLKPISLKGREGTTFECALKLRADNWERRHRYNGFVLLLTHPELQKTAKEIALLYRAKDMVEKDFQCIKSVVKLRPVFHRTDPKVVAHVSLCMLALLLERSLEHRLADGGLKQSASAAIERLSTCHLNLMQPVDGEPSYYSVTETTPEQMRMLEVLGLPHLVDDETVAGALTARVVTT